jgi:ribosomal protein S12 methylthiotransferase
MPSRYGDELVESMPEVDAFVPVADEGSLLATLERLTGHSPGLLPADTLRTAGRPSAYLQVSDGCFRSCAYCTIPSIRGPFRSMHLDDIAEEAELLASGGAKEIVLIGQDISAYGRDLDDDVTLSDVIATVASVEEVEWIRLMYVQPDGITEKLLNAMAAEPKVCHYLDMPLQHASEAVLRRMNRSGGTESFLHLIARIRALMPDMALRTSVIAGYPGETRRDVRELHDFIRRAEFNYVGVFAYSPESGTVAAELDGLPTKRTRLSRAQAVRDIADEVGVAKAAEQFEREIDVLIEDVDEDGTPVGRWRGQAPEVDGVVLLDSGTVGTIVRTRIVDVLGYDLEGEVL